MCYRFSCGDVMTQAHKRAQKLTLQSLRRKKPSVNSQIVIQPSTGIIQPIPRDLITKR